MGKIYEAYKYSKKSFYLLFFIYVEIISTSLIAFEESYFSAFVGSLRNLVLDIKLTPLGNIIRIILILLLIIPPILLTIRGVKDKLKVMHILSIWICILFACIFGYIIVYYNTYNIFDQLRSYLFETYNMYK